MGAVRPFHGARRAHVWKPELASARTGAAALVLHLVLEFTRIPSCPLPSRDLCTRRRPELANEPGDILENQDLSRASAPSLSPSFGLRGRTIPPLS